MKRFMTRLCALCVLVGTLICAHARGQVPQGRQAPTVARRSAVLTVIVAMKQDTVAVGTVPVAYVTVSNLTDSVISFPSELQVHVEGSQGAEPATTLRQRQMTHSLHAGEYELFGSGFEPDIPARGSFTKTVDLSKLYDLKEPGTYTLVVKVMDQSDPNAGVWVRSDPITFTVKPVS